MPQSNVNIRMDSEIKKAAEAMFADMGLNISTAVNIFVRQTLRQGKIPFEITSEIPNAETLEAMREAEEGETYGPFDSVDALMEALNA